MQVNRHALRIIRERSGLTLSQLARAAGVSQPHLSNVEAGRRRPSPGLLGRLAHELRVPVVALLSAPVPLPDEDPPDLRRPPVLRLQPGEFSLDLLEEAIDVDDNPDTTRAYGVESIPTLLLFRDGEPVASIVGARPKPTLAAELDALVP